MVQKSYDDASFATNNDLSTQLGVNISICDKTGTFQVLDDSYNNSNHFVRPVMVSEVNSFSDAFERAFILRKDLDLVLEIRIPLHLYMDSKQLFDSITKRRQTTENRLIIDISATHEAYRSFEITQMGLVSTHHNPADGMSKVRDN